MLKAMFTRIENAKRDFDEVLSEIAGINATDAALVRRFYLKNRLAKIDVGIGRINVKHGAYLDASAIHNALALARK